MKSYFAGGCFWCIADPFYLEKGVIKVISGYSGGSEENPRYEDVKAQKTGHRETIEIEYDENIISYRELLNIFFQNIDPFDDGGQFIDRGSSYTTAIFYRNEIEKDIAYKKIEEVEEKYKKDVKVSLIPFINFYNAEEYHQEYSLKNKEAFQKELEESGRISQNKGIIMEELLKKYHEYKKELAYYRHVSFVLNYDATTDSPKLGRDYTNDVLNFFEMKALDITLSSDYINTINELYEIRESLDIVDKLDIEIEHKEMEKVLKVPRDEMDKHIENLSRCYLTWAKARETLDYAPFKEELKELVEYNKKYILWQETDSIKGFDVLIDEMEEGYKESMYDEFFEKIEKDLLPFIKEVLKKPQRYNPKLDTLRFDINKQKELTEIIRDKMGYTGDVGCIRETIHPYTDWSNNKDVRITTRYYEDLLFSNLYSIMHEIGHALFQLQMDDKYNNTNIFNNVSCITHESQSRFYENYLGRSRAFVSFLYPVLKEIFPIELDGITEDDIYYYVNSAKAGYNRCEADELTYPLHVLIRYKVEKALFHNEITVDEIEETFNKYMMEYLGLTPENELIGCFQDSHWTASFGYFPTYAVGSAYGAMFIEELKKAVDVDKDLKDGNFKNINLWLKENIHKYSGTRNNNKVIEAVCHKKFDVKYYIDYLKKKFSVIYGINE